MTKHEILSLVEDRDQSLLDFIEAFSLTQEDLSDMVDNQHELWEEKPTIEQLDDFTTNVCKRVIENLYEKLSHEMSYNDMTEELEHLERIQQCYKVA